jgi:hypothetical protein
VERVADSIAVDIGDVRLLIGARCCRLGGSADFNGTAPRR